jgi:hypothetical protein
MAGPTHIAPRRKRVCLPRRGQPLPPETRAKIAAAQTLRPPAEEVAAMLALYRVMGLRRTGQRVGYDRAVVRRALLDAGVSIRAPGRHPDKHGAPHG